MPAGAVGTMLDRTAVHGVAPFVMLLDLRELAMHRSPDLRLQGRPRMLRSPGQRIPGVGGVRNWIRPIRPGEGFRRKLIALGCGQLRHGQAGVPP